MFVARFRDLSILAVLLFCTPIGCGDTPADPPAPPVTDVPKSVPETVPEAPREPKFDGTAHLNAIKTRLEGGELDAASDALKTLATDEDKLSTEELAKRDELIAQLADLRQKAAAKLRAEKLAHAQEFFDGGDLEEAGRELAGLLALSPTEDEKTAAHELEEKIEVHRRVRRRLRVGMELMESTERGRVREGQNMLWEEPEVAFPLLLSALKSENSALVANSLEMLRRLNQPNRTLPAMLAVLRRPEQSEIWPVVIKELQKIQQPGAGPELLDMALNGSTPEQKVAALSALSGVVDAPRETVIALLPKLNEDSPDLAAALTAAYQSVVLHRQQDLVARRGLDFPLTAEQEKLLSAFPDRLDAIIQSGAEKPEMAEAAWAAQRLAVATRQMELEPFTDVKIVRATNEIEGSPAAAVFDGVWNSTDVTTMWRHPPKAPTTIVFDLGEERTVTSIRIWNFNEVSGTHRGWKEMEVYVSNSQSPINPVATATLPIAPGIPEGPDYGCTVQVPFERGRFVKLQFLSVWRDDGVAGLSEVQILGY